MLRQKSELPSTAESSAKCRKKNQETQISKTSKKAKERKKTGIVLRQEEQSARMDSKLLQLGGKSRKTAST